ncbi:Ni/Fe-hydrogenase 1 B-type cytochrome subunit [Roseiarcus fermentans]|uniref:Probable Ni/Fe-hydrogenase B-type cytochrome subunit n=1 Tax=Roseiarcus fermentans TaxID=1473586 RepID=A0A366F989_9HYPH|nr:Ni/Fe-hydrogenase, b-type cytochrome subunit [Roseiarcus fermentans]RBP11223.1 Ni/Fe-hydrogenase 1 B-type cytochrome subunit [Roseiarcus fermentans]
MSRVYTLVKTADAEATPAIERNSVFVYEAPVRTWHWVNAILIVVLIVSGYLIGSPPPTLSGEASAHYQMGYIRFGHFAAAQLFIVASLYRVYWAFVGNEHARQLFYVPFWKRWYWYEALYELSWYLFIVDKPKKWVGHNPLANLAMVVLFTFLSLFMIVTGGALYAQGAGNDTLWMTIFGWVFVIWPNSQEVHTLHHVGMWVMVIFIVLHVYAAIREDIMSRQTMLSAIVTGDRYFRD